MQDHFPGHAEHFASLAVQGHPPEPAPEGVGPDRLTLWGPGDTPDVGRKLQGRLVARAIEHRGGGSAPDDHSVTLRRDADVQEALDRTLEHRADGILELFLAANIADHGQVM